jgi:hypothetical protein
MNNNFNYEEFLINKLMSHPNGKLLTDDHICEIVDIYDNKIYEDGEPYSCIGDNCYHWGFLVWGLFKVSNYKNKGKKEIMRDFNFEGYNIVVGDMDAIMLNEKSKYNIVSKGQSNVLHTTDGKFNVLARRIHPLAGIGKAFIQSSGSAKKNYHAGNEDLTCPEKYVKFNCDFINLGDNMDKAEKTDFLNISRNS